MKCIMDVELAKIKPVHKLLCHCEAVEIELKLPNGLENLRKCNCSMCSKRNAVVASVKLEGLSVLKGGDKLSLYQFNTKTAKHYFCSICGIYTHHQRRSVSTEYGFNIACLEGVDSQAITEVSTVNGIEHPSDRI